MVLKPFILLMIFSAAHILTAQELRYADLQSRGRFEKKYDTYISKDGLVFKVGDRLKIGKPSSVNQTFTYIVESDFVTGDGGHLSALYSGFETEIKRIRVAGNRNIGYRANFFARGVWGPSTFLIIIEPAIETGEIQTGRMTPDEALAELKRAKDKLDLGLITLEEYEKIKAELARYIK